MKYRWGRIIGLNAFIFIIAVSAAPFLWVSEGKAIPGMQMGSENIGGKSKTELEEFLKNEVKTLQEKNIVLTYKSINEKISFKDLEINLSKDLPYEILKKGRSGKVFEDWYTRWEVLLLNNDMDFECEFNKDLLNKKVEEIIQKYNKEPRDTLPIIHDDGTVTFDDGVPYLKINKEELINRIALAIKKGVVEPVEIPVLEEKIPKRTKEQLKGITNVLGKYTTTFGGDYNRSRNIELAANSINGTMLMPGESFSYNNATGSRSSEHGYLSAPVIVGGKLVPGTGGGVCQVSSTLFNALLYSGLDILERTSHFNPISYTPIGQDATVAEGYLDLKFRNNMKNPIYLYTEYSPGIISIYILGAKDDVPESVQVFNNGVKTLPFEVVKKVDSSIKENKKIEYGHEGYQTSVTQRVTWKDGRVHEDTFSSDYEAVNTIIYYANEKIKNEEEKGKENKNKDVKKSETKKENVKNEKTVKNKKDTIIDLKNGK